MFTFPFIYLTISNLGIKTSIKTCNIVKHNFPLIWNNNQYKCEAANTLIFGDTSTLSVHLTDYQGNYIDLTRDWAVNLEISS